MDSLLNQYEAALSVPRAELNSSIQQMLAKCDAKTLGWFLIYFCSHGVAMTQPVELWIRRAGERCLALRYTELGDELLKHSKQESNHHIMMIRDATALIHWWNRKHDLKLLPEDFIKLTSCKSAVPYETVHEKYIESDTPYGQLAIEYEIEKISIVHGPILIKQCIQNYGIGILMKLGFIRHHVKLDFWHTRWNQEMLTRLLKQHPDTLEHLIAAGTEAIRAYQAFFLDISELALSSALPEQTVS